jgi:hypothetical protein
VHRRTTFSTEQGLISLLKLKIEDFMIHRTFLSFTCEKKTTEKIQLMLHQNKMAKKTEKYDVKFTNNGKLKVER